MRASVAEGETTESIPFRFVLPGMAARHFVEGTCFHRRERRFHRRDAEKDFNPLFLNSALRGVLCGSHLVK